MIGTLLDVLVAISEGDHDLDSIAATTGLSPDEAHEAIHHLHAGGYLLPPDAGLVHMSPSGRQLGRLASDEHVRRLIVERLGGAPGSAS